jgi:hypothetical protein
VCLSVTVKPGSPRAFAPWEKKIPPLIEDHTKHIKHILWSNAWLSKMLQASNAFTDLPLLFQGLTSERLRRFNLQNRAIISGLVVNSPASYSKYLCFRSHPNYRLSWHRRGLSQSLQKYVGLLSQIRPKTFGITAIWFYYSPTIPSRDKYVCIQTLHSLDLRVSQTTARFAISSSYSIWAGYVIPQMLSDWRFLPYNLSCLRC